MLAVARTISMAKDKCPICNCKLTGMPHVPSDLDYVVCPLCFSCHVGFYIPKSLGLVDVVCRCEVCGHKWSVRVELPKNFFG